VLVVVVLATPVTFRLLHEVYRGAYDALETVPGAIALVRFGLALLALAPATVLMGATLPTLTRHLTRDAHLSAAFGRLYAANTLGAIIGTFAAGLVLIELLGLTGTLVVGALCSTSNHQIYRLKPLIARAARRRPALGLVARTAEPLEIGFRWLRDRLLLPGNRHRRCRSEEKRRQRSR